MIELKKDLRKFIEAFGTDEKQAELIAKNSSVIQSIVRIPGDASSRHYFRVTDLKSQSYIVMRAEPFPELADKLPFLVVQKHLASVKVDVPKVIDFDPPLGMVLLEDLGDITLLRRLQDVGEMGVERHLYERVIDSLVQMQVQATPRFNAGLKGLDLECFKLSFDFEKLFWEVNFTIEQFYQLYLKRNIRETDEKILKNGFSEICRLLASQPQVFTQRDFHSRNIMVAPGDRLVMIDFQDARMGPAQYDLASLLKDSYYQLEETQTQNLIDYYIARWEALSREKINKQQFLKVFDLMAIQRNFKAIGSFASFLNKRNDATYLKYIGNTFENIRRVLLKYPEYSPLREVLFHYYYF